MAIMEICAKCGEEYNSDKWVNGAGTCQDCACDAMELENAALRARVEKLREALKFYAEEDYIEWVTKGSPDEDRYEDVDHGKLAQNAIDADLAECEEGKP